MNYLLLGLGLILVLGTCAGFVVTGILSYHRLQYRDYRDDVDDVSLDSVHALTDRKKSVSTEQTTTGCTD